MNYSAKSFKRFFCALLALVFVFGSVVALPLQEVEASTKLTYQKRVRMGVGPMYSSTVSINFAKPGDKIANLKSSSKNLVVRPTYRYQYGSNGGYTSISLRAKKAGSYKVTFDVRDANNKKIATKRTITVTAKGDGNAISQWTVGKRKLVNGDYYRSHFTTTGKSANVRFTVADKNVKIRKIEVFKYDKNGKSVKSNLKNGKKLTFGTFAYSHNTNGDNYSSWSKGQWASTTIVVTYTDKRNYVNKASEKQTAQFSISRPASKWYTS